jgi:hypothetical protein
MRFLRRHPLLLLSEPLSMSGLRIALPDSAVIRPRARGCLRRSPGPRRGVLPNTRKVTCFRSSRFMSRRYVSFMDSAEPNRSLTLITLVIGYSSGACRRTGQTDGAGCPSEQASSYVRLGSALMPVTRTVSPEENQVAGSAGPVFTCEAGGNRSRPD